MEYVLQLAAGFVVSSGLIIWFIQRWLNRKLSQMEKQAEDKENYRIQRCEVDDEYFRYLGQFCFWVMKGIERFETEQKKAYWNGDTKQAFYDLKETEEKRKALDRKQLARMREH